MKNNATDMMGESMGPTQCQPVIAGNVYDKWGTKNPVARYMFAGFKTAILDFICKCNPTDIHEVDCGEGNLATFIATELGIDVKASDYSEAVIAEAQVAHAGQPVRFKVRNIHEMNPEEDAANLIVCCELLEHLEDPDQALVLLQRIACPFALFSVPREPVWRLLNILRGHYLDDWGNTPGHIQHFSRNKILNLLKRYFSVLAVRTPFPWTMALCCVK